MELSLDEDLLAVLEENLNLVSSNSFVLVDLTDREEVQDFVGPAIGVVGESLAFEEVVEMVDALLRVLREYRHLKILQVLDDSQLVSCSIFGASDLCELVCKILGPDARLVNLLRVLRLRQNPRVLFLDFKL